MEIDILKQAALDHGTKINVIRNNTHKYSVSAMCDVLNIPKNTYYGSGAKISVNLKLISKSWTY